MTSPREPAPTTARGSSAGALSAAIAYITRLPGLDYLMIRLIVLALTGIGVVMVFSSSMTWSVLDTDSVWGEAVRHSVMVIIGLGLFWAALKVPLRWVRRLAPWGMLLTLLLLVLVLTPLGTGRESVGSQSWLPLGPIQVQPSEVAKVTLSIWGATYLAGQRYDFRNWRSPFTWYTLVAGLCFVLIFAQGDLGMALSFAVVVAFTLIFAGVAWGLVVGALVIGAVALAVVFAGGGFRAARFHTYFDALSGNFDDTQGAAFQSYQGFLSLADGSLTGVGLGQSRAKWFYLPEAKNDFIFAVIGEELGLIGGGMVILLFCLLGVFGLRTALRAQNQFQALLAGTLTVGVVSQAFINIGYVVGLLPVTGIQLPMISAGGTSAIITLTSMGLLASVARHEPQCVSAMQNYGRPLFDRLLFLREPGLEGEKRPREDRSKLKEQRFGAPVTATRTRAEESAVRRQPGGSVEPDHQRRSTRPTRGGHARRPRRR
ncbi:MAG TPA: putative peptidoglycan glycosyltransferase FtsW [Corynebacterium sp.]|nr:putative peptidoglycan glycosyltransferase FtsW [Corynebacterium sp.]